MPKITPAVSPARKVPSRSNIFTPRSRAIRNSTTSAPQERIKACSIGGMSGSASLTAIWLKPQLRQSISISATAPGVSGRPADGTAGFDDMEPRSPAWTAVLLFILAVRANAGDFDHGQLWCKARRARGGAEALRHRGGGNLADRPAGVADQERHRGCGVVIVGAGEIGVAALDAVDEAVLDQEIERAVDRDRRRPRHRFGEFLDHFIGPERTVAR